MKKLYESLSLSLAIMLMLASVALAQERVVTGTVVDETGTGMPGVNVLVKGTTYRYRDGCHRRDLVIRAAQTQPWYLPLLVMVLLKLR